MISLTLLGLPIILPQADLPRVDGGLATEHPQGSLVSCRDRLYHEVTVLHCQVYRNSYIHIPDITGTGMELKYESR